MADNPAHGDMLLPFSVTAFIKMAEDHVQSPLVSITASSRCNSKRYRRRNCRMRLEQTMISLAKKQPQTFKLAPLFAGKSKVTKHRLLSVRQVAPQSYSRS